jgi:hypothetical protein
MMKYSDNVIKSYCAALIGSSPMDAISYFGESSGPFASSDDSRLFQESLLKRTGRDRPKAVFLGDLCASTDEAALKGHNIKYIVNLCDKCPNSFPGLHYLSIPAPSEEHDQSEDASLLILEHIDEIIAFIQKAEEERSGVLIHSTRGASRAFFAAAAYLMKTNGWNVDQASAHIMAVRPSIEPSDYVLKNLMVYAASLSAKQ